MGACCAYQFDQQQDEIKVSVRKRQHKKKKNRSSVIIEQKSAANSFSQSLNHPLRSQLHQTIESMAAGNQSILQSSLAMGSIMQMGNQQHEQVLKHLTILHLDNEDHNHQLVRFCNFKTKNFLHTHKIKLQGKPNLQQISCCPYNSGHTLQYDIWKLQPVIGGKSDQFYIYHPFTTKYLAVEGGSVCGKSEQYMWTVHSLGKRRNLGFVRFQCKEGWLCMTDQNALVKGHRQLTVCKMLHISHLWQLIFSDANSIY